MNWKNHTENLSIVIVTMILTAFITHKATLNSALKSNQATNDALLPAIIEGIKKETVNNEITNEIDLDIDKIKKSDTLQINVNQEPLNKLKSKAKITSDHNCAISDDQYNMLTESQKRRLSRWLEKD